MQATQASVPAFDFAIGVTYKFGFANYFPGGGQIETGPEDKIVISGAFSDDLDWDAAGDENDDDNAHRNKIVQCSADFCWKDYNARFICFYSPYQHTSSHFQLARCPYGKKEADEKEIGWPWLMNLRMKQDLGPSVISIQQRIIIPPMYLGGRTSNTDQVLDDAGRVMISARLELAVSANPLWLWGKEVQDGEDPTMSADEKKRIAKFERNVEHYELLVGGLQSLGVYQGEGLFS